jgi:hypothetical protein
VPYFSYADIKALYPPTHHVGDWDSPKVDHIPHEKEIIERCQEDIRLSLKASPDPFRKNQSAPPGASSSHDVLQKDGRTIFVETKMSPEEQKKAWAPWQLDHPFPAGKLSLISVNKDPDARIIFSPFPMTPKWSPTSSSSTTTIRRKIVLF